MKTIIRKYFGPSMVIYMVAIFSGFAMNDALGLFVAAIGAGAAAISTYFNYIAADRGDF